MIIATLKRPCMKPNHLYLKNVSRFLLFENRKY